MIMSGRPYLQSREEEDLFRCIERKKPWISINDLRKKPYVVQWFKQNDNKTKKSVPVLPTFEISMGSSLLHLSLIWMNPTSPSSRQVWGMKSDENHEQLLRKTPIPLGETKGRELA